MQPERRGLPQDCTSDGPYTSLLRVVNAMSARTAAALLGLGRRADMCMRSGTRSTHIMTIYIDSITLCATFLLV
jgi:hypothetical protein